MQVVLVWLLISATIAAPIENLRHQLKEEPFDEELFAQYLPEISTTLQNNPFTPSSYKCTEITPPGFLTCNEYKVLNWCSHIPTYYCALTCNKCCYDVPVNPFIPCSWIRSSKLCSTAIQSWYCLATCSGCGRLAEYYALSVFQKSIKTPSQLASWNGGGVCTSFVGVGCDGIHITNISLTGKVSDVQTSIPEQFSLLSQLKHLSLYSVGLIGSIPPQLSILSNLEFLHLYNNGFTGSIAPQFSLWNKMEVLLIGTNQFTGTLPPQLSTWTSTQVFSVGKSKVSGSLPMEYSTWSNIKYDVWLQGTSLSGQVPPQLSNWKGHLVSQFPVTRVFQLCGSNKLCTSNKYQSVPATAGCPICK